MLEVKPIVFPQDIRKKIEMGVRKNVLKIEFNAGAEVLFDCTNIKITKPHNIIFRDEKKRLYVIAYIVENESNRKASPNIYINYIHKTTKCSITSLIDTINKTFFPSPKKRS